MAENDWMLSGNADTTPPDTFLGTTDNQPLVIKTNGTEAARVGADGKIGVGITDPRTQLHIHERISTGLDFDSAGAITFFPPDGFAWFHIDNGPAGGRPLGRLRISYGVNPGDYEIMNLLQDGNVGIGTSGADAKLEVSSGGDFNAPQLHIAQTTPREFARLRFHSTNSLLDVDRPGDPPVIAPAPLWDVAVGGSENVMNFFFQNLGNLMTLTPNGRVGIRTEQPTTELDVHGTASVGILQITGGGDLAEPFAVEDDVAVEPGTVMIIDAEHPGQLKISGTAYDRKVAGVVSGAGGLQPGLILQHDAQGAKNSLLAMTGRAYCKAEALSSPIEPGDRLTTSDIPGHAMKAMNGEWAQGAIIGKAMSSLPQGTGLVLVLVNLQ